MNQKLLNYFNRYTLFMAFPILMVFSLNISLVYFALMYFIIRKKSIFFQPTHWIQVVVLLFGLGAVVSVIDSNVFDGEVAKGWLVLPNYIYWSIIVIFIVNLRYQIDYNSVAKYCYMGIVMSIVFYYVSPLIPQFPGFINSFSPNGFAFLCICFTAPAATYLLYKKGLLYAVLLILVVLITLLFAGRRSGFVLVFISSILSVSFKSINFKYLLIGTFTSFLLFLLFQLEFIEQKVKTANPRVYELIYENDNISVEDRSYLTRKLMIEKSLIIFKEHPLTGVGLNNFANFEVHLIGDFEGAQFVLDKEGMNSKSAHNSYASLLGEGGLILLFPFFVLLLFNFYKFILYFGIRTQIQNAFYWGFLCACVHMFFISALFNVYAWFMIGILTSLSSINPKSKNLILQNKILNK